MLLSDRTEEKETQRHRTEGTKRTEISQVGGWRRCALGAPRASSPQMQAEVSPQESTSPARGWQDSGCLWLGGLECLARPSGVGGEQQVLAPHAGS